MQADRTVKSGLRYGRELVNSGMSGLRNGRDSHLHGQPLCDALGDSARAALGLAAVSTCLAAVFGSYFAGRRHRGAKALGFGVAGSAVGFLIGFAWKTRDLTRSMGRSALREMGTVRDQHWLQRHPIDYA